MLRPFTRSFVALAVAGLAAAGCTDQPFTVDVSLRVVSIDPSGGSEGFNRHSPLRISFSEDLDAATVTADTISLAETDGAALSADVAYSNEGGTFVATLTPAEPLKYSTSYTVSIANKIKRKRDGSPLSISVTSKFKSEDPAPLAIIASSPSAGSANFSRTGAMTITFSEPVKCESLKTGVKITQTFDVHPRTKKADADLTGAWECKDATGAKDALEGPLACKADPALCTVTFKPTDPKFAFEWSSHVNLALEGGKDVPEAVMSFRATKDGGYLLQDVAIPFHVENPPAFTVAAVAPAAGATGVDRKPTLTLTFSEPVRCETLLQAAVVKVEERKDSHPRITAASGAIAGTWMVGGKAVTAAADCPQGPAEAPYSCKTGQADDPCVATFTPAANLEWSSTERITLAGGSYTAEAAPTTETFLSSTRVTSHGGTLGSNVVFDFRVKDPPALQLVGVAPGSVAGDLKVAPATLLRDGVITLKFSEPVACATANADTIKVTEDADGPTGNAAAAVTDLTLGCSGASSDTLTLTRTAKYAYSAIVHVSLAGGAFGENKPAAYPKDNLESAIGTTQGGQLAKDLALDFVVEDPPALLVLNTTPPTASNNAALTPPSLKVTFNQPVQVASVSGAVRMDLASMFIRDEVIAGNPVRGRCDAVRDAADPTKVNAVGGAGCTDALTARRIELPTCALTCADANADGVSDPDDAANPTGPSSCACTYSTSSGPVSALDYSLVVGGAVTTAASSSLTTWRSGALKAPYDFKYRAVDPRPLLVASTSPSDQATNVPGKMYCDASGTCAAVDFSGATEITSGIVVRFDRAVDCGSVGSSPTGVNTVEVFDVNMPDPANPGGVLPPQRIDGKAQCATDNANKVDPTVVVFSPSAPMRDGAQITLNVKRADIAADSSASPGVASGVRSADWTDAAANDSGTLVGGLPLSVHFKVSLPLLVVSTNPANGEQNANPNQFVAIKFNQQVDCPNTSSVLADALSLTDTNGTQLTAAGGQILSPANTAWTCANGWDAATLTARFLVKDPAASADGTRLKKGMSYVARLKGGIAGPRGINGAPMPADYVFTFKVATTGVVIYTVPARGETNVDADAMICAVFKAQVSNSSPNGLLTVTFVPDVSGRQVQVIGVTEFWNFPIDPTDPNAITPAPTGGSPGNAICLRPTDASYDGLDNPQRLPYGTTFTATVTGVTLAGTGEGSGTYTWNFTTRQPPQIKLATYTNDALGDGECLDNSFYASGACRVGPIGPSFITGMGLMPNDVPVNATFVVDFSGPVATSSLTGFNAVLMKDPAPGVTPTVGVCASATSTNCLKVAVSNNGTRATFAYVSANVPQSMAYAANYGLILRGGSGGITLTDGNFLKQSVFYLFRTSPSTSVAFDIPPGETFYKTQQLAIVYSRPIRFSTATEANIRLYDTSLGQTAAAAKPMTILVAVNSTSPRQTGVLPTPTYGDTATAAKVLVTTGLQDFRGNPLPLLTPTDPTVATASAAMNNLVSGTTPASSAIGPSSLAATSVTFSATPCTATANEICGNQSFTLTFGNANGKSGDRMIPATFNPQSVSMAELASAGGCTARNIPLSGRFVPGTNGGNFTTPDSVEFTHDATPFKAGCSYTLTVNANQFANLYTLSPANALPITIALKGDTAKPTITAGTMVVTQTVGAAQVALNTSPQGVRGDSPIVFQFSEEMDPATFSAGGGATDTVVITNKTTNAVVTGGLFLKDPADPRRIAYLPSTSWVANTQYDVSVKGGTVGPKDVAGNVLAATVTATNAFRADNTAPVPTISATLGTGPAMNTQRLMTVTFSEPMRFSSFTTDTFNGGSGNTVNVAGNVRLRNTATNTFIAVSTSMRFDGVTLDVSTLDSNVPGGSYELQVVGGAGAATDKAGNAVATSVVRTFTFP